MPYSRWVKRLLTVTGFALLLSGCATIVGDKTQLMNVASAPAAANIRITDETGATIFEGKTPTNVVLQKSNGHYWGKKSYQIQITRSGYAPQIIPVTAKANGWYIAGNLVFGGLIGWFVVDPFNGAMYTLSPTHINASLERTDNQTSRNDFKNGKLTIMLVQDVPKTLRPLMVPVGTLPIRDIQAH